MKKVKVSKEAVVWVHIYGLNGIRTTRTIFKVKQSQITSFNEDLTLLFWKYRDGQK